MLRALKIIHESLLTYLLLLVLAVECLVFSVWALLMYPLLSRRAATAAGRRGITGGFRFFSWLLTLTGAYRLDLSELRSLPRDIPLILAPNHPSLIDALLILTRHPNIACVLKAELMQNVFLGAGSRLARYIPSDQPRQMIKDAVADLRAGGTLLLFPEGTRTTREPLNPLKASIGVISKHANVPVQVLLIETDSPYLGKGWPLLRRPNLPITCRVRLGKRFDPPADVGAFMVALEREYTQQLAGAPQSHWLRTEEPAPTLDPYAQSPGSGR